MCLSEDDSTLATEINLWHTAWCLSLFPFSVFFFSLPAFLSLSVSVSVPPPLTYSLTHSLSISLSLLTSAGPKCYVCDLKHCSLLPQLTAVKRAEKHVQESIARIKVRIN